MSERRVTLVPDVELSVIGPMVVAMQLTGIVLLDEVCDFVEEVEQLSSGLVGEIGG